MGKQQGYLPSPTDIQPQAPYVIFDGQPRNGVSSAISGSPSRYSYLHGGTPTDASVFSVSRDTMASRGEMAYPDLKSSLQNRKKFCCCYYSSNYVRNILFITMLLLICGLSVLGYLFYPQQPILLLKEANLDIERSRYFSSNQTLKLNILGEFEFKNPNRFPLIIDSMDVEISDISEDKAMSTKQIRSLRIEAREVMAMTLPFAMYYNRERANKGEISVIKQCKNFHRANISFHAFLSLAGIKWSGYRVKIGGMGPLKCPMEELVSFIRKKRQESQE